MSWNRPTSKVEAAKAERRPANRQRTLRWLAVVAVVMVIGGGLYVFRFQLISDTGRSEDRTTPIKDVRKVRSLGAASSEDSRLAITPPTVEKADIIIEPRKKGREIILPRSEKESIFSNEFEGFLCDMLTAEPGERFLEMELDENFDEAYKASLTNRIVIAPTDSEEVAEIKRAVIEARERVIEHVKNGGSPREIVLEARDELNKIADFRDELEQNIKKLMIGQNDPAVVKEYADEADRQLKEYGIPTFDYPSDNEQLLEMMEAERMFKIDEEDDLEKAREMKAKQKQKEVKND